MIEQAERAKAGPDDRRSIRIGLALGVFGAISAIVYTVVYYWLYYLRLTEVYFGTYDPLEWSLVFGITNRVYLTCVIFLSCGFFVFLRRRDARFGMPFVILLLASSASVFMFYPYLGSLAFWPTLVTNFVLWFGQGLLIWLSSGTGANRLLVKVLAVLSFLNPVLVYGVQQLLLLLFSPVTPIDVLMHYVPFIVFRLFYYAVVTVLFLREGRNLRTPV